MRFHTKSIRILGGILVVYALLVATHLGEFWPLSIYPMFSKAGHPWNRAMVCVLPPDTDADAVDWSPGTLASLPGTSYPLEPRGVNQNDVANYVSKTTTWTAQRVRGLRSLVASRYDFDAPLLVYRVQGSLAGDSVRVETFPVLLFTEDGTRVHPSLRPPTTAEVGAP